MSTNVAPCLLGVWKSDWRWSENHIQAVLGNGHVGQTTFRLQVKQLYVICCGEIVLLLTR